MTLALQKALCLEFLAHLLNPKTECLSTIPASSDTHYIYVGKRKIKMTQADFEKVRKAHDQLEKRCRLFCYYL